MFALLLTIALSMAVLLSMLRQCRSAACQGMSRCNHRPPTAQLARSCSDGSSDRRRAPARPRCQRLHRRRRAAFAAAWGSLRSIAVAAVIGRMMVGTDLGRRRRLLQGGVLHRPGRGRLWLLPRGTIIFCGVG
jgi:hypothetical protein